MSLVWLARGLKVQLSLLFRLTMIGTLSLRLSATMSQAARPVIDGEVTDSRLPSKGPT